MRLTVRLFAVLRERAGTDEITLEDLPDALDLMGLKAALAERHPELGDLSTVAGVVGDTYAGDKTVLAEGDAVALLPDEFGPSVWDEVETRADQIVADFEATIIQPQFDGIAGRFGNHQGNDLF